MGRVARARATKALGQPQARPVRGTVDGSLKTRRVDKGLQQEQPLAETIRPIRDDALLAQRKHLRTQIGAVPVGQNQKSAVVGDQPQTIILMPEIPANPAVTNPTFPRRSRKTEQRGPIFAAGRDVPERVADLGQIAQIVVLRHQRPIPILFGFLNRAHTQRVKFRVHPPFIQGSLPDVHG